MCGRPGSSLSKKEECQIGMKWCHSKAIASGIGRIRRMSQVSSIVGVLAAVVLLPILPAYLLFRLLPSSSNVSGLLQGLEIKLGGAFGGYFILVVLILTKLSSIQTVVLPPAIGDQVWHVEGQILDEAGKGIDTLGPTDVQLMPRQLEIEPNGNFEATFVATLLP